MSSINDFKIIKTLQLGRPYDKNEDSKPISRFLNFFKKEKKDPLFILPEKTLTQNNCRKILRDIVKDKDNLKNWDNFQASLKKEGIDYVTKKVKSPDTGKIKTVGYFRHLKTNETIYAGYVHKKLKHSVLSKRFNTTLDNNISNVKDKFLSLDDNDKIISEYKDKFIKSNKQTKINLNDWQDVKWLMAGLGLTYYTKEQTLGGITKSIGYIANEDFSNPVSAGRVFDFLTHSKLSKKFKMSYQEHMENITRFDKDEPVMSHEDFMREYGEDYVNENSINKVSNNPNIINAFGNEYNIENIIIKGNDKDPNNPDVLYNNNGNIEETVLSWTALPSGEYQTIDDNTFFLGKDGNFIFENKPEQNEKLDYELPTPKFG